MAKEIKKDDLEQVLKDFLIPNQESGEGTEPMAMSDSEAPDYSLVEDADYEDVFCFDKLQDFLDNGCKKIDVDLYMAVNKFQYDKVRELILQGANPDANLVPVGGDESDPYNCRSRVGDESAYLSCEVLPLLTDKYHGWVINYPVNATQVENVIGYAAHEVMWDVMMKSNNKSGTIKERIRIDDVFEPVHTEAGGCR